MTDLIIILTLLALGYFFGRRAETKHYHSIIKREKELRNVVAVSTKFPPNQQFQRSVLVTGSVVISVDYFKRFLSGLRNLVGGRVTSYETVLDRARREAILRMKKQAKSIGAPLIFNVKLETASITKGRGDQIGSVEVLAYGTALVPAE